MLSQILTVILFFLIGYALGRLSLLNRILSGTHIEKTLGKNGKQLFHTNWLTKKPSVINKRKKIEINESKFVTKIDTSSYKKTEEKMSIGKETVVVDDVGSSISKLKKLKSKKG